MRSSTGIKRFAGLLMGGVLALLAMGAQSESAVTQGSKAASLDACVAPTADMRRNHMDYLKHDRVKSVRQGVRGIKYSLSSCIDCHASKDDSGNYKPVTAEGEFCQRCHNYVAVELPCFGCHRTTPQEKRASLGLNDGQKGSAYGLLLDANGAPALSARELSEIHAKVLEH